MSRLEAPLYVRSHDLAQAILERFGSADAPQPHLRSRLIDDALALVSALSLALTFRPSRSLDLTEADRALLRLRVGLRLARDVGVLSAGGLRHLEGAMLEIGRMIGGWRKRVDGGRPGQPSPRTGDGPPPPGTA